MRSYRKLDTRWQHPSALTGCMPRMLRITGALMVVFATAVAVVLVHQSVSITAPSFSEGLRGSNAAVTQADGLLPDRATVFDEQYAGVKKLKPSLLSALRRAATAATDDNVQLYVNSGWRSPAYQSELLSDAVAQYGSLNEAARWVATPQTSPHVSGDAVDIGPSGADVWLSQHGADFGLCEIYRNEPWHFELRPAAITSGCPRMYADPTQDPRMQS